MESNLMTHFQNLTEFLGLTLKKNCEVALLDLRPQHQCITAISNGHNSGRTVGAPITDFALKIVQLGTWKEKPFLCNYTGLTYDNRQLVSSSFFIKENDELLGMFCINITPEDTEPLEEIYQQLSQVMNNINNMLPTSAKKDHSMLKEDLHNERFASSLPQMFEKAIISCLGNADIPIERLTQDEKISIVQRLNTDGFFLIKGSVSELSIRLNCSEATIYRYLSKISKQKN